MVSATPVKKAAHKLRGKQGAQVAVPHLKNRGITPLMGGKLGPVTKGSIKIAKPPLPPIEDREDPHPLLQWPADAVLRETTRNLLAIKNAGMEYEHTGDYFNSGDLAYQLQEILRSIQDLCRKTQRLREAKNS